MIMLTASQERRLLELLGTSLGPIWPLLHDNDQIVEIMVNPDGRVWVDELGLGMRDSDLRVSPKETLGVIQIIASSAGAVCNDQNPSLAAVLPGSGARFQGFVPPIAPAPWYTIRKRARLVYTLTRYVEDGVMTHAQGAMIAAAITSRRNILIAGGTGSGKTTLANAILDRISLTGHRILTIEDTPELQCAAPNNACLYVNEEAGFGWQHAIKAALRVRPDRIVVGEVRDGSALDLLKAWNTGHNGGCATLHANSALRALTRLESLIQEVTHSVPRELVAEAVNVVVFIERFVNAQGYHGRRVREVAGIQEELHPSTGAYQLKSLYHPTAKGKNSHE